MNPSWQQGWWQGAERCPSPNFSPRPPGEAVSLVVLHNISLPPFQYGSGAIRDLFANRINPQAHPFFPQLVDLRVSSHFLIERSGRVVQFVSGHDAAHHAGVSSYQGRSGCNAFSLGIELEGCDFEPFTEAQYQALIPLLHSMTANYPIAAITGHQHIAPGRKSDPGHFFDWPRLAAAGLPLAEEVLGNPANGAA
ncbi:MULTISPECIES: 1,6-anhydro-N-acetylmuramyl-L-alanine amidase AmpD [Eikenella]|uniref:1,6-anhydro-N-acetylmuramyl-L-alanine amidase AmpD n=1 Tax=Eikenella longinqua TaxID=1795827 RepID=A0A1A9RYQ6_9NEIS|nr:MULTISPECIES: 1,6-anhydro-N-acetylmuramyl-L-alanine amidase AmpD [Eikenella]OAM29074.1 N-acetyl-anhydromuranmyl-L-alanine amidase [Eikenella longinqua]